MKHISGRITRYTESSVTSNKSTGGPQFLIGAVYYQQTGKERTSEVQKVLCGARGKGYLDELLDSGEEASLILKEIEGANVLVGLRYDDGEVINLREDVAGAGGPGAAKGIRAFTLIGLIGSIAGVVFFEQITLIGLALFFGLLLAVVSKAGTSFIAKMPSVDEVNAYANSV